MSAEVSRRMNPRWLIAAAWGALIGSLTFAAGPLGWLSGHWAIAAIQIVLTYAMFPGLLVAAMVGSLLPAAIVNALVHFALCLLVLRFVALTKKVAED